MDLQNLTAPCDGYKAADRNTSDVYDDTADLDRSNSVLTAAPHNSHWSPGRHVEALTAKAARISALSCFTLPSAYEAHLRGNWH